MNPKVFISYSWDSKEHEEWVVNLVADLRRAGIIATLDKSITQEGNVNLDKMMIDGFKDSDKVILVLTENYAEKSDNNQGGVGFETIISLPVLRTEPNKLIPISRHNGRLSDSMPFHLKSNYIIDFSKDAKYFEQLTELIYKIREVNLIELPEVGELKELTPRKVKGHLENSMDALIPNLTEYKEQDKNAYLIQEMNKMWDIFIDLSKRTMQANHTFTYEIAVDEPAEKMIIFKVNDNTKIGIHMRIHSMFSSYSQIVLSYGTRFTKGDSSSFNEMISCSVNSSNELELSGLSMNFGGNKSKNPIEMAKNIWSSNIVQQLKY